MLIRLHKLWLASYDPRPKNRGDPMPPIPRINGLGHTGQRVQSNDDAEFFANFPDHRSGRSFPKIDLATGQTPCASLWWFQSLDQ